MRADLTGDAGHVYPPSALVETHTAWIALVADVALKVKKPVRFPFLDFSTPERREAACRREVELNRRLAPDAYLGVWTVLGPGGAASEHLVAMRRMPAERSLAALVERDDPRGAAAIDPIADQLAAFHRGAERGRHVDRRCERDAVRALWTENFREMRTSGVFPASDLDRAEALAGRFLDGREVLFVERIHAGAGCDGHGDLQASDIFVLDDGPRILDCIEFDDRYRYGDVAADVAFLVMDLERLGRTDLARRLLMRYEDASGTTLPRALVEHFVAYRAQVRAKVAALRARQEVDPVRRDADTALARQLLDLCLEHLERGDVRVALVGGLPGSGKSTLGDHLGDATGATVLRSDVIRRELLGEPEPQSGSSSGYGAGRYGRDQVGATYDELLERARHELARGRSVVLDASWSSGVRRAQARELARNVHAHTVELVCEVDDETAAGRIRRRAEAATDASEATAAIRARMADDFDDWPEAAPIDTRPSVDAFLPAALAAWQRATATSPASATRRADR
ncbi:MAG TPA: AAA family ATPase [Acidimicrobiales bacterium]|nr:AAA family ATPase [Acidimicrobiales bacterium]